MYMHVYTIIIYNVYIYVYKYMFGKVSDLCGSASVDEQTDKFLAKKDIAFLPKDRI